MTLADIDPTILEWLYAREAMRSLGFTPEEIFFVVYPSGVTVVEGTPINLGGPILALEIHRGDKTFVWTLGTVAMPAVTIQAAYESAADLWNATCDEPQWRVGYERSKARTGSVGLVLALTAKGFTFDGARL